MSVSSLILADFVTLISRALPSLCTTQSCLGAHYHTVCRITRKTPSWANFDKKSDASMRTSRRDLFQSRHLLIWRKSAQKLIPGGGVAIHNLRLIIRLPSIPSPARTLEKHKSEVRENRTRAEIRPEPAFLVRSRCPCWCPVLLWSVYSTSPTSLSYVPGCVCVFLLLPFACQICFRK